MYFGQYNVHYMFDTIEIKEVKEEIGTLVKVIRKQRGISQVQLAQSIDVSRTTLQSLENGNNSTIDTLLKVIKELDLLESLMSEVVAAKRQVVNAKPLY